MIIFADNNVQTRSDCPVGDWTSGQAKYTVQDGTPLAEKILAYAPHFTPVEDKEGNLADVTPLPIPEQTPTLAEQITTLKAQLADTDYQIIKAYEYALVGLQVEYDITALHAERQEIRDKINELEEQPNE